jgi:uncharacterized RDD family membrane protein YckC
MFTESWRVCARASGSVDAMMPGQPSGDPARVNPYAPPASSLAAAPPASTSVDGLDYAGFAVRAGAQIIDWIVGMILGAVAGMVCGVAIGVLAAMGSFGPDWARKLGAMTPLSFVLGIVGATLYHAVCEGLGGATVGKLITGLRVRAEDGSPARIGAGLLRSIAFLLDGFFFGMVAYGSMSKSRMQQRLGDKWAHTVVVRAASLPPTALRPKLALGIVLGCVAQMAITALDTFLKVL